MPNPKDVFDHPEQYWDFITANSDNDFEGQHFDRKEAGPVGPDGKIDKKEFRELKKILKEVISAFANLHHTGGLVVLGVSKHGIVKGLNHLDESQLNSLTNFGELLRNQVAIPRFVNFQSDAGGEVRLLLIYVPPSQVGICETLDKDHPKAWLRSGAQNLLISREMRQQIERDKKITASFELAHCCPFHIEDIDQDVLEEFRKGHFSDVIDERSDIELLYEVGAIDRDEGGYMFTNVGYLFFAINPQRKLSWTYIRLEKFGVNSEAKDSRGLPIAVGKTFDGAIPQQIRKVQDYLSESGFFKTYQKRNVDGTFVDDPELPKIAVDEVIVNAVAHRDYSIQLPIECFHYQDAFVVENPGCILQRDRILPSQFTLDTTTLNSKPRNSKLIEWLKAVKFVRAISEGTKRMQYEMTKAELPSPQYEHDHARTSVTLLNDSVKREAILRAVSGARVSTEFANLFPIIFVTENGQGALPEVLKGRQKDFMDALKNAFEAEDWYVDRFGHGRMTIHRRGGMINLAPQVEQFLHFYPAYTVHLRHYWTRFYLSIDYTLQVKNIQKLSDLLRWLKPSDLKNSHIIAKLTTWQQGKLIKVDSELSRVYFFDLDREEWVRSNQIIPSLSLDLIKTVLSNANVQFDLSREIKRHSFTLDTGGARLRAEKTLATAQDIASRIFPLTVGELQAVMQPDSVSLRDIEKFNLTKLPEPEVEFINHQKSPDIRIGITDFGAYQDERKKIELLPICTPEMRENMASLIHRLRVGKYRYKGAERTFSTQLHYSSILPVQSVEDILGECKRLLDEHPDWIGNTELDRLFLVYTPEKDYALDDENSPYYRVKKFLFEQGVPCQMVDTPTLLDPDWKDLNLALNIVAKCGITPWVLPNQIPDADFFVGLSYTQTRKRGRERLLGYATVFNEFGRWEFYSGSTQAFSYEERTKYFASLTQQTLERLDHKLHQSPHIYFHYSARFSKDDQKAILQAAREIRPYGTYSFVSINLHHNIRLYDRRPETDGSLSRGSYIAIAPNRILLSTTGYNSFRKSLGTPQPLEVTIWTEKPDGTQSLETDHKSLATQILKLTKLNWASTASIAGEPITTKYAGDIAYLTDAFLRQTGTFRLHPILERTPWFI